MEIYDTNDAFDFNNLVLTKPTSMTGGNYFIKCLVNSGPLYIQPPKCKTKQGIIKAGKRYYSDLMFTNEHENFIRWMENLENHCQAYIYKNREKWFDGDMELHDIENYFTSPLKIYKSGNYYLCRINITNNALGKPTLKIYDEHEKEIDIDKVDDKTKAITILEIQGIKCSSRSFQIEIELKQMMVLEDQTNLFEKCIIKPKTNMQQKDVVTEEVIVKEEAVATTTAIIIDEENENKEEVDTVERDTEENIVIETTPQESTADIEFDSIIETPINDINEIQEVEFNLEELDEKESVQLKQRNEVYYDMYREARKKAKRARDLALSSYLEAKRIKNTYMLDDIRDSDESDLEMEDENFSFDEE
jgi:hypothetical protein